MAKHSPKQRAGLNNRETSRRNRNFPKHGIEQALAIPQKIQDEMGGKPMKRLLLADAIGLSPSSSTFRDLLSSSYKYGLTEGTEKADEISLTTIGVEATQASDGPKRLAARRTAALRSPVFGEFFRDYANKKVPSPEMFPKILSEKYAVPADLTCECAELLLSNGSFVELIRDIAGSSHVLMDNQFTAQTGSHSQETENLAVGRSESHLNIQQTSLPIPEPRPVGSSEGPRPIFVAHGKNKAPVEQLQTLLNTYKIPHRVVMNEANLGRPISQKVKDTIEECGSAILIFTRDEEFKDNAGNQIWRPSENVIHELGASSFAYGDRIMIFKEKGLHFPTNFQGVGHIEFEPDNIKAQMADLLKELIGFGLVRVTPT